MNITEVRITKLKDSKTLALANITLDSEFVVSGLKVLQGQNGLWVAMPNRKDSKGEYHDICFPITKSAREKIQLAVINKYQDLEEPTMPVVGERETIEVKEDDLPF